MHEAVELYMGQECELHVEFSGLMCWGPGARIGWHRDDVRVSARHYAAVLYLSNAGEHFTGVRQFPSQRRLEREGPVE